MPPFLALLVALLNLRVGTGHLDFVRVVLDLDSRPIYEVEGNSNVLEVSIEGAECRAKIPSRLDAPPLAGAEWKEGKLRLRLSAPTKWRHFILSHPWRLVIDLRRPQAEEEVAPGVVWIRRSEEVGDGRAIVNLLRINPRKVEVRPAMAGKDIHQRDTLERIARREGAIVAINGGFFDMETGTMLGLMVMGREWIKSPDVDKSALLFLPDGRVRISPCGFCGTVTVGENTFPLHGLNVSQTKAEMLVAYNRRFGSKCPQLPMGATRLVVEGGRVREVRMTPKALPIPEEGWVISATGRLGWALALRARAGQPVKFSFFLNSPELVLAHARGAGPKFLEGGKSRLKEALEEGEVAPQPNIRRARTAAGITAEGDLLLLAVERLEGWSVGATLEELAQILRRFGAVEALNLDGGGATAMFARGEMLTEPEKGKPRPITDALVVLPRKRSSLPGKVFAFPFSQLFLSWG